MAEVCDVRGVGGRHCYFSKGC